MGHTFVGVHRRPEAPLRNVRRRRPPWRLRRLHPEAWHELLHTWDAPRTWQAPPSPAPPALLPHPYQPSPACTWPRRRRSPSASPRSPPATSWDLRRLRPPSPHPRGPPAPPQRALWPLRAP